ncbi:ankyrin repeat domain-containing protein 50 [Microdochium nivale]|nr:ankyrin repeat domain-containing protein 50 [Microdochium nivale]
MELVDSRPQVAATSCIWRQSEALIRRLYLQENHTLEELKNILETQHSFPITPLSTYESKVRDVLRLRKKLKKPDWIVIYQHWVQLNGKVTKPRVFFHDREIPWVKAWKEIRRYGAQSQASTAPNTTLPRGVRFSETGIRTSHTRCGIPRTMPKPSQTEFILARHVSDVSQSRHEFESGLSLCTNTSVVVGNLRPFAECLGATPATHGTNLIEPPLGDLWVEWKELLIDELPFLKWADSINAHHLQPQNGSNTQPLQHGNARTSFSDLYLRYIARAEHRYIDPPEFMLQHAAGRNSNATLSCNFDTFYHLSKIVFLFSNVYSRKLDILRHDKEFESIPDQCVEQYRILMRRTSQSLLEMLLDNESLSIWAFWETMISISAMLNDIPSFRTLAVAGSKHSQWMAAGRDLLLGHCARYGLLRVLEVLLALPGAMSSCGTSRLVAQAVLAALDANELACGRVLLSHFGANFAFEQGCSIFRQILEVTQNHRLQGLCLDLCLELGADVDTPVYEFALDWEYKPLRYIRNLVQLAKEFRYEIYSWRSSVLDHVFLKAPLLFERLVLYSRNFGVQITRSGVWDAARQSVSHLTLYLASNLPPTSFYVKELLEIILAEQALKQQPFDCDMVLAICRYFEENQYRMTDSLFLPLVYLTVENFTLAPSKSLADLLRLLVDETAELDSAIFEAAIGRNSIATLELLLELGHNVRKHGGSALAWAICHCDERTIEWLISHDVDFTASVDGFDDRKQTSLPCAVMEMVEDLFHYRYDGREAPIARLFAIFQNLTSRCSTWLKNVNYDPTGSKFLLAWVATSTKNDAADTCVLREAQFFLHSGITVPDEQRCLLLEASVGYGISTVPHSAILLLENLLEQDVSGVSMGGVLARLIFRDGPVELVHSIIETCTDIWAPDRSGLTPMAAASFKWNVLLQRKIYDFATARRQKSSLNMSSALAKACEPNAFGEAEQERRLQTVEWLVKHGASVNIDAEKISLQKVSLLRVSHPTPLNPTPLNTIPLIPTPLNSLTMAVNHHDFKLAHYLLDQGARPNAETGFGPYFFNGPSTRYVNMLALDIASRNGSLDIVQLLLNAGAVSGFPGGSGYDGALKIAYSGYHGAVVELLKAHIRRQRRVVPVYLHSLDELPVHEHRNAEEAQDL